MKVRFICHPDFSQLRPIDVFHKEMQPKAPTQIPSELQNKHILFRKKLTVTKPEKAVLKISADDRYKLYINGRFVTEGPAPSYPCDYFYNEADVTELLNDGENTFAVHTYYQGLENHAWISNDLRSMMYFELVADGKTLLVSDESWKCAYHTGYSECGRFGYDTAFAEFYDSNAPEKDFFAVGFDDSEWLNATVYQNADWVLTKQPTSQLDVYDVEPVALKKTENGYFIDFGRETVGYLSLTAKGKSGDTVIMRFGEELLPDGGVRYKMRCNCTYEEKWKLSGAIDTLMQYDYKAFRYAELNVPSNVELLSVKMTVRHYPYEEKAVYSTDNEKLKRILRLCADTVKYGTQECYVDCPTREKGQYLGDVSVSARAQAVLTGKTDMMKKAIREFCVSSFICDGIMSVSHSARMQEIADYSLQLPAQICWVYSMDGDIEFVRYTEPYVTGMLKYFLRYANTELLLDGVDEKWNLVDWPANLRDGYDFPLTRPIGKGIHNVINAFWYGFLKSTDELYRIVGKTETGLTEKVGASFKKAFYNEKTGLFTDSPSTEHSAIHSNVLPLLFGLCDGENGLKNRVLSQMKQKGLYSMGVYMAYFALASLAVNGEYGLAEELATDERCWLNMLKEGATTTFEAWGVDQKWNTSLFHPWATAPSIIFADGVRVY